MSKPHTDPSTRIPVDHVSNAEWRVFRASNPGDGMALNIAFFAGRFEAQGWVSLNQARALAAAITAQCDVLEAKAPAEAAA